MLRVLEKNTPFNIPEERLWFAVLERAVMDIGRVTRMNNRMSVQIDSTKWFETDSYITVCDLCNVCPVRLMRRLKELEIL